MNIAKIADRAPLLFPFVTPGLSLQRFAIATEQELRETFRDPFAPPPRPPQRRRRPPLALSDAALQALIDRSWSRRDRWTPFQEISRSPTRTAPTRAAAGAPPRVSAPERPAAVRRRVDPRSAAVGELGLAADHVEFIGFISGFASAHPGTKATTELLFLLDQLAQANMDALPRCSIPTRRRRSIGRATQSGRLQSDRRSAPTLREAAAAQGPGVRATGSPALRQRPARHPDRHSADDAAGYRASDARFLIGAIHWRAGTSATRCASGAR